MIGAEAMEDAKNKTMDRTFADILDRLSALKTTAKPLDEAAYKTLDVAQKMVLLIYLSTLRRTTDDHAEIAEVLQSSLTEIRALGESLYTHYKENYQHLFSQKTLTDTPLPLCDGQHTEFGDKHPADEAVHIVNA